MPKQIYKIVLIGDGGVGKTSLKNQYLHGRFTTTYKTTIGADFLTKDITKDNKTISLQIWDTAGQERFQSLGIAYYRGADACVMVYDVNNYLTFENLTKWRTEFLKYCNCKDIDNFPILIIGNKLDLDDKVVSKRQVNAWLDKLATKSMRYPWIETSAKYGTNVEEAFQTIVDLIPHDNTNISYDNNERIQFLESSKFIEDDRPSSLYSQNMVQLTPAQIKLRQAQEIIYEEEQNKSCCSI